MLKNNYHTHMKYCNHAIGESKDYIDYAIKLNFNEIGMSDHGPIPLNSMNEEKWYALYCNENMNMDTFEKYVSELDELKIINKDKIKIYKALETEYLDNHEDFYKYLRSKLDYMVLGMHFFNYNDDILDTYRDVNYLNVDGYYNAVEKAIKSGLFNYLAHPDLYLFDYKSKNGINEFDSKAKEICLKLINLCVKYDIYFEINANGLKFAKDINDRSKWRYPNIEFFKCVKEYMDNNSGKLKLIIGADAHKPIDLNSNNIKLVEDMIKDLGLDVLDKIEVGD